ncbi:daunorubicin ABC transporter ATP-binding protein [Thermococcus guaymasensis DSM 11113]|uniref:Daunorubicin ABC transporter ATP-binding protein n=1 Tax=Thermococcus guaymasensis DSM 11113 TaxID=1432656 RepID=A0A0X1KLA5_9EURY|nr:ABC transporter ATP-binding protein [Thermococcus guaymasensis]AJC72036.1 daunorubicin ABC transporter ATP-binding protein [Thermococcus guaymasensis DSM 11113]
MAEAVVAKNLVKRYGDFEAVKGISFTVKRGEAFALLGPNGAGKTTTVRMLTTLTSITSGEAYVNGFDVKRERLAVRRSIGLVPDVSNLYDELTVRENLLFMAKLYDAPPSRVDELIKEFELPADRKFGRLSTGFKRRATIAAALVHEPEVLFLDEPTNGLDVHSAKAVRALIRYLNKKGMTVFITTHNMVEAETIPQRIAIMRDGRIVAEGKRNELAKLVGKKKIVKLSVEPLTSSLLRALEHYNPSFEEGLVFKVDDVDAFLEELYSLKAELGFRIEGLCTEIPGIEEVLVELTKGCSCGGCPL